MLVRPVGVRLAQQARQIRHGPHSNVEGVLVLKAQQHAPQCASQQQQTLARV